MGLEMSRYRAARHPSYTPRLTKERLLTRVTAPQRRRRSPTRTGFVAHTRNPGRAPRTAPGPLGRTLPAAGTGRGSAPHGLGLGPAPGTALSGRGPRHEAPRSATSGPAASPRPAREQEMKSNPAAGSGLQNLDFFFFFLRKMIEDRKSVGLRALPLLRERCLRGRCEEDGRVLNKGTQKLI